jgi:chromosomal replication initiator protein
MSLSPAEVWKRILDRARQELPDQTFQAWLEPTEALSIEGSTIFVGAPDQFTADWNDSKHGELLSSYAPIVLGHPLNVVFRVNEERKRRSQMDFFVSPPVTPTRASTALNGNGTPLSDRYTFDLFVIGKSNELAAAAAHAVSQAPGKAFNPLFIYGDTGLGKTHLMQAIGQFVWAKRKNMKVLYVSSELFINEFIDAIQHSNLVKFRKRYRQADLLLIDDIQFLGGKERSQEEFFHTFNTLFDGHKQIVLSSDRPASEIANLEHRLVSRFEWGLTAELQPPAIETRLAILRKKADAMQIKLHEDVFQFLASRIRTNVRRLEGALMRVASFASLSGRELTNETVEHLLKDILQEEGRQSITIEQIQRRVAEHFDVRLADMTSKRRPASIAFPRQVAMYLARELTKASLNEIGDAFGGRDHGTVLHACKLVKKRIAEQDNIRQTISYIDSSLQR